MSLRIGVDLGGTKIEVALLELESAVAGAQKVVCRHRKSTPRNYPAALAAVVEMVGEIDALCAAKPPVGIGTPGAWVASTRTMKNCNSLWLNGKPLLDDLNAALDERVRVANDANCFALSEALSGAGRGAAVVFGVILGTGVGGGIVVEGKLLPGANAIGGEWGHTPLPYLRTDPASLAAEQELADRHCYCGRMNCVETFLSGPGLSKTHQALTGERLAAADIPSNAPSIHLYTTMLARSLAQIVNVLDPHAVVLGGGLSNIAHLEREVSRKLPRYGFSHEGRTNAVVAEHGDSSGVFGAARLWP